MAISAGGQDQQRRQRRRSDFVRGGSGQGEEGWIYSYADMVTLLFAFFVVLLSISSVNMVKYELLTQHFKQRGQRMTLKELKQKIQEYVVSEKLDEEVKVSLTSKGVEINFKDKLLFSSGKADIKEKAMEILSKIGELLNYKEIADRKISVEGHTDSLPIKSEVFPSNWELSSARSASVVRFFISKGLDHRRFESLGFADTRPIIEEKPGTRGQPANRRVVVVITPNYFLEQEARQVITSGSHSAFKSARGKTF